MSAGSFSSPRVLVVDPNPGLRRVFTSELEDAGYSALGAESTVDARQFAEADPPAAIVLNATWAPESAVRLIGELRTKDGLRDVPIVGIAWVAGREQRLLEAGADYCLRRVPARGDVLKAVEWALAVHGESTRSWKRPTAVAQATDVLPTPPVHEVNGRTRQRGDGGARHGRP